MTTVHHTDETDRRPRRAGLFRWAIAAVVAAALITWQVASLMQSVGRAEHTWNPAVILPVCDPTGMWCVSGGHPFGDGQLRYNSGSPKDLTITNYDLLFIQRTRTTRIREAMRLHSRLPTFFYPMSLSAWSADGRLAVFDGKPAYLSIVDAGSGRVRKVRRARYIAESIGVNWGDVAGIDVLDWQGTEILCRLETYREKADHATILVLVDENSGRSRLVARFTNGFRQGRVSTACLIGSKSVLYAAGGRLWRVKPGGKPVRFAMEIGDADQVTRNPSGGPILVAACWDKIRPMRYYLLDPKGDHQTTRLVATATRTSWVRVGPNGEVFATGTPKNHVRMIYPRVVDLGNGMWPSAGGSRNSITVWQFDRQGGNRMISHTLAPGKDYRVTSTASYDLRAPRKFMLGTDWAYFGGEAAVTLVCLGFGALLAMVFLKRLPGGVKYLAAAVVLFVAYKVTHVAGVFMAFYTAEYTGVAPGTIVAVDVTVVASLLLAWRISSTRDALGLSEGVWRVARNPWLWVLAVLPVFYDLFVYAVNSGARVPSEMSFLSVLIPVEVALVAVWEELIFRGFLWRQLQVWKLPAAAAILIQAAVFVVPHYVPHEPFSRPALPLNIAMTFAQGAVWGIVRWRSKSILPGVVGHAIHNVLTVAFFSSTPWIWQMLR